jgi:hypothetical protein
LLLPQRLGPEQRMKERSWPPIRRLKKMNWRPSMQRP